MLNKIAEASLLFDFYGQLLTKKQQQVMRLYHEENYSLSEIGDEFSISRQGVHDTLKKAENALTEYEKKLGLVNKLESSQKVIAKIEESIDQMMEENDGNKKICEKLINIKDVIETLNQ
ncbi:MAG: YlxM family DNA-binding protein [Peptostreptococcaceae bacterium]|nr:YlxM family DNA-binding protein [Peptostreptococcaceae bacterium]